MCIRDRQYFFFFKQKTAYEISACLVGSEMCIRDSYWIVDLDEDYQWAIVGEQSRTLGWILSRNPVISTELYEKLKNKMQSVGYDTARLNKCQQIHSTNPQQ
eukprot:TRINITY_DN813_c0_g1_i3.p2 TRINITY_DN813_c0_g1~~TRINITY_DN813_c0_g1_i3.p2  ORF type:complete len:102 (-),score=39.81 TRINITY_DN813_c0_g1_i3:107-412(-)